MDINGVTERFGERSVPVNVWDKGVRTSESLDGCGLRKEDGRDTSLLVKSLLSVQD